MVGKASLQDAAHYPPFQLFLAALWMLQASSTNQESEHIFKCVPLQLVVCALGKPASVQGGNKNNRKGRVWVCQQYQECRNDSFAFSSFFLTSTASTNTGQLRREIRRSTAIAVVLSSFFCASGPAAWDRDICVATLILVVNARDIRFTVADKWTVQCKLPTCALLAVISLALHEEGLLGIPVHAFLVNMCSMCSMCSCTRMDWKC